MQCPVLGLNSHLMSLTNQQCWSIALVNDQKVDRKLSHHDNARQIFGPSPAEMAGAQGATNDGAQGRSANNSDSVGDDGVAELVRGPYVCHYTAGDYNRRAAEKTGEEAGDEDGLDVFGGGCAEGEDGGDEVGLFLLLVLHR